MSAVEVDSTIGAMGTIAAIASDTGPVTERGRAVLEELKRIIPFEAGEICSINPLTGESMLIASEGYSQQVLNELHSVELHELMEDLGIKFTGWPVRMRDLPGDPLQSGKWIAMLLGAGSMAIGLDGNGTAISIPGLTGHKLLMDGTELLKVAKDAAVHNSWGSFVWPDDNEWFRVRVVPCRGEQPIMTVVSMDSIDIGPLSRRELEVLTLAAEGLSNQEIGDALVISNRTVATHVEHILAKLSAPNRAAAAAYALREGLIMGQVARHDH